MGDASETASVEFSMAVLCYRTGRAIVPFVEQLHQIMSMFVFPWEVVLVANYWPDDQDETPAVAAELSGRLPNVRVVAKPKQGAMGWDMRMGLDACRGRFIGVIDGDGQFPLEAVFSCFAKIRIEDLDFVKTYRVHRADGLYRNVISFSYNLLFRVLFPEFRKHRDANSKPKILRRAAYERMTLESDDWFLDAELMLSALRMNLRIGEIPVQFRSLSGRPSFVRFGAIWEFTRNLFLYRWKTMWPGKTV